MTMKSERTVYVANIILAILLLLCIIDWPYNYFLFIRYTVALVFFTYTILAFYEGLVALAIVSCLIAVLFQPFEKFYLGRQLWLVVDIVLAVLLFLFTFFKGIDVSKKILPKKEKNKSIVEDSYSEVTKKKQKETTIEL